MYVCLTICLSVYQFIYQGISATKCLPVCLSVYLFVCLPVRLPVSSIHLCEPPSLGTLCLLVNEIVIETLSRSIRTTKDEQCYVGVIVSGGIYCGFLYSLTSSFTHIHQLSKHIYTSTSHTYSHHATDASQYRFPGPLFSDPDAQ